MDDNKRPPADTAPQDENQIIAERRAKLAKLRETGPAFPNDFRRKDLAAELQDRHGRKIKEELEAEKPQATVAGRLLLQRLMGKASVPTSPGLDRQIPNYVHNQG